MNRVRLTPYNDSWFPLLQLWVPDKEVLLQYSGTHFSFPLTQQQINAYRQEFPDRRLYMALLNNITPFAFGEIIPQDDHSARLARLLIGNQALRGQGLGTAFVNALVSEAKQKIGVSVVELFVFGSNEQAIHCYRKAGFSFIPGEDKPLMVDGVTYIVRKMRLGG